MLSLGLIGGQSCPCSSPRPSASACDVLELLGETPAEPQRLAVIARRLDMPRATCQTVLLALCDRGFVVRHEADISYSLGPACVRLGEAAALASPALAAATEGVARVAAATGLGRGRHRADRRRGEVAETIEGVDPFGPAVAAGLAVPLVAPFGAVFVAWADDDVLAAWFDRCDPPLTRTERQRYSRTVDDGAARGATRCRWRPSGVRICSTCSPPPTRGPEADRRRHAIRPCVRSRTPSTSPRPSTRTAPIG